MPIYEYVCATCGDKSDHLMRLSDPDPDECPKCGPAVLTRAVSAPSFRLSGSGWYETDFKKDGDRKKNLTEGSAGGDKPAEAKPADSKPAESKPAESKPAAPASE